MDKVLSFNLAKCSIDLGLHFAWSRLRVLLGFALIPIILKIISVTWQFYSVASLQRMFLATVVELLADSWLLTMVVLYAIYVARGQEIPHYRALVLRSFQFLPKIFLSYALLSLIVGFSLLLLPLMVFAVYFIWAPYFCAAETFIEPPAPSEEDEEEDLDEDEASHKIHWLEKKALWELGFARSVHMAGANVWTTLQLALLIWLGNAVPMAMVGFLSPTYEGIVSLLSKSIATTLVGTIVLSVAGVVFVACLPAAAREELGIAAEWEWNLLAERTVRFRLQGRPKLCAVLTVVAIGASYAIFDQTRASLVPPSSVETSIEQREWVGERFRLELRMRDNEAKFSWLVRDGLRLFFSTDATAAAQEEGSVASTKSESGVLPSQLRYKNVAGDEVVVAGSTELPQRATLILYFDLSPERAGEKATLEYLTQLGDRSTLVELRIPDK